MPKPRRSSGSGSEPPFNPAALRALMERTLGGLGRGKRNDEHRAQDLVYDAMEASTWERRLRLVRQALELDPENVDALLMVAEASELKGGERIEALRGMVAAGAKRLGKKGVQGAGASLLGLHRDAALHAGAGAAGVGAARGRATGRGRRRIRGDAGLE